MIVYGKQIFLYILEKHSETIEEIYLAKEIENSIFKKISRVDVKIIKLDNKKAQAFAKGGNHQGYLLKIKPFVFTNIENIKRRILTKQDSLIVVLDGLNDLGNIGAIIRTSYSLGVDAVIVSGIKNLNVSPVVRTSSGTIFDLPVCVVPNSKNILNEFKQLGCELIGADMNGEKINEFPSQKNKKTILFLGSEESGLSNKVKNKLDNIVSINMSNNFNSLNVSVAAGIIIHVLTTQG